VVSAAWPCANFFRRYSNFVEPVGLPGSPSNFPPSFSRIVAPPPPERCSPQDSSCHLFGCRVAHYVTDIQSIYFLCLPPTAFLLAPLPSPQGPWVYHPFWLCHFPSFRLGHVSFCPPCSYPNPPLIFPGHPAMSNPLFRNPSPPYPLFFRVTQEIFFFFVYSSCVVCSVPDGGQNPESASSKGLSLPL